MASAVLDSMSLPQDYESLCVYTTQLARRLAALTKTATRRKEQRDHAIKERDEALKLVRLMAESQAELDNEMRVIVTRMALASIVCKVVLGPSPSGASATCSATSLDTTSASGTTSSGISLIPGTFIDSTELPQPPCDWPKQDKDMFVALCAEGMGPITRDRNSAAHTAPLSRVHGVVEKGPVPGRTTSKQLDFIKSRCLWWTGITWAQAADSSFRIRDRAGEVKKRRRVRKLPKYEKAAHAKRKAEEEAEKEGDPPRRKAKRQATDCAMMRARETRAASQA